MSMPTSAQADNLLGRVRAALDEYDDAQYILAVRHPDGFTFCVQADMDMTLPFATHMLNDVCSKATTRKE